MITGKKKMLGLLVKGVLIVAGGTLVVGTIAGVATTYVVLQVMSNDSGHRPYKNFWKKRDFEKPCSLKLRKCVKLNH